MSGIFLQNTKRSLLRPLACQGIFATDCYHQVCALLQDLGPNYVALLAEPVHSDGVAGQESIDWYAHATHGDTSIEPKLLSSLSPEEKAPVLQTLHNLAQGIHAKAEGLVQSAQAQQALSGEILKLALQYPHEDAIWVIGNQPIVTQWGFAPGTVGAQPEDLARVAAVIPVPPTPPVITPVAAVAPSAAVAPTGGRGCLAWLLPLLLLFLLLMLLLAALGLLPFALPWPTACMPEDKIPLALEEEQKKEHVLLSELDALRLQLREKAALCIPPKSEAPKLQIPKQEAYVEEPPVQEPVIEKPAPVEPPLDEPFLGMTPVEEPKKEEPKKAEPPKKQEPKKEPPKKPKKNDPLEIPKDKNDMAFLEGCWVSETGLVNMRTREPVVAEYCFDKSGKGKRLVREKNGTICTGNVTANFTGNGALVMETGDAFCPGGGKYAPQKVDCTGSENSTTCNGQELGMGRKVNWDADFRRKN